MSAVSRSSALGPSLVCQAGLAVLLLAGCHDTTMEPDFARVNTRYTLTIKGTGSQSRGVVTSDRGGVSCTVAANGTVSGKCSQGYKSGSIVTLYFAPSSGANLGYLSENCQPSPENPLACDVQMTGNREVIVNFNPQSNTATLTISGGAGGSGNVTSSPSGISCPISNGTAGSTGCAASFPLNTSVTLTATASSGSYLKAWAGGGCESGGTGVGRSSGTCTVSTSQAVSVVVSFDRPANTALVGQWGSPFAWPGGLAIHASVLPNGKVMSWGRMEANPVLWDPPSNAFGSAARPVDLFCSGHALLPDGRLLVSGGHSGVDNQGIKATVIYDYRTNVWSTEQNMQNGRWYPSVLTLANGEALTISGGDTAKALNRIPEVWNSNTRSWRSLTAAASNVPYYPMLFVAPNGLVYMAGPGRSTGYLNTAGTGSWTAGPASVYGDRGYGSAVMYEPGKILLVGGGGPTATAERIDLNAGGAAAWTSAGSMQLPRRQINATLLADGSVLVTGGTNATGFNNAPTDDRVLAAERWNPGTGGAGTWTVLARQTRYRLYHSTAVLLPDGRVLSFGSGQPAASGISNDFTAELFSPPYLFNLDGSPATRPTVTSAPNAVVYGQMFSVGTPAASGIRKVTWIRLSSVTHATDMNQRNVTLNFSASDASTLQVAAPGNANLAPPGDYMLFLIDANGIPSVAKIIRIS